MLRTLQIAGYSGLVALLVAPLFVPVPVPLQMMGLSLVIIIIASINAAERDRKRRRDGDDNQRDVIGRDQAYRFPLVASSALLGMFLAFKYLPNDWVSFLLTLYGVTFGGLATGGVLGALIASIPSLPPVLKKEHGIKDYVSLNIADVFGFILAAPLTLWYYKRRAWLPNNVLATGLALSAIDMLALSDFLTAAVLLLGLFFYDIFWVFGSKSVFGANVMVSVAKQFEGPIKLVFPRFVGATAADSSMLGLGDIVIPGLFVALMLRFDTRNVDVSAPMPSRLPYFSSAVVAYFAGLLATYVALTVFEAAQPALLYLVPSCLITAIAVAQLKGELSQLLTYTEEEGEGEQKQKDDKATDSVVTDLPEDTAEKSASAGAAEGEPVTASIEAESKKDQ